ncbi:DUF1833 family protein [Salipiger bermudensis]|uniref:DUF1833 family protein n=1 Tax=Salipiger bermudensis TaxID=344736 RepID=UPI001CD52CA3|nr:DUF1833 family protein [Salipiger bermudensis]MCA0961140.1 DUF1833 domain-containing protein [Salipiger bermudensis]
MRQITSRLLAELYAGESSAVLVPLVKLTHANWSEPVLLVRDDAALIHAGEEYLPFPFEISLPDDRDKGFPVLKWSASNVSREIIGQFRAITGEVLGRVVYVLTSHPDVVEVGPFEVEITGIEYDALTISGVMTIEPILQEQFGYLEMTPGTTPALF